MREQHVILVRNGGRLIGVFSNLKLVYDELRGAAKPAYSTVSANMAFSRRVDLGACVFWGVLYEGLSVQRVTVNRVLLK
jgi:hypothetical protein